MGKTRGKAQRAPPAPSAPPPHEWEDTLPSTTCPLRRLRRHLPMNGRTRCKAQRAPPAPSAPPPHEWGGHVPHHPINGEGPFFLLAICLDSYTFTGWFWRIHPVRTGTDRGIGRSSIRSGSVSPG